MDHAMGGLSGMFVESAARMECIVCLLYIMMLVSVLLLCLFYLAVACMALTIT
jgi:hypothetical protein